MIIWYLERFMFIDHVELSFSKINIVLHAHQHYILLKVKNNSYIYNILTLSKTTLLGNLLWPWLQHKKLKNNEAYLIHSLEAR